MCRRLGARFPLEHVFLMYLVIIHAYTHTVLKNKFPCVWYIVVSRKINLQAGSGLQGVELLGLVGDHCLAQGRSDEDGVMWWSATGFRCAIGLFLLNKRFQRAILLTCTPLVSTEEKNYFINRCDWKPCLKNKGHINLTILIKFTQMY